MAWLGKRVCSSKCEERDPAKLPPDSYTHEECTPKPDGALGSPAPPCQAPQFPRRLLPQGSTLSPVSPLLYGEETPEVAKRDKGLGENNRNKSQSPPWTRFPTQSSLRACRAPSRPGQAAFSGGGGHVGPAWAGLLPGRNPPTEGYTCACSSAAGVGWGGVGLGVLQQEEEVGLGDGVEKGEVLHQAWALEAKASRASRPCPSPRWLPHGSGLTHTHSPGLRRSFPPPCSSQWAPWPGAPLLG